MARADEAEPFEPDHFIDRDSELRGFGRLLEPETPQTVMFIEAGQFMGKTWLLYWMGRLCSQRGGPAALVPMARIDFWEQEHEIQDTLSFVRLIRDTLRQPGYFSDLNAVINGFTQGRSAALIKALNGLAHLLDTTFNLSQIADMSHDLGIQYEDLKAPGGTLYEKCYSLVDVLESQRRLPELFAMLRQTVPDLEEDWAREEQSVLAALAAGPQSAAAGAPVEDLGASLPVDGRSQAEAKISKAFFACLHKLEVDHKPVVILFDSVERAPDWAELWIRDGLLGQLQVHSLTDVVVIIAGRDISKLKRADPAGLMVSTTLKGFEEQDVRRFLDSYRVPYDEKELASLRDHSQKGKPGLLALITADKRTAQEQKEDPFFQ